MRNTTKLKTLLMRYTLTFDRGDDEMFVLILIEKQSKETRLFEARSYSTVVGKAYSYLLKELKKSSSIGNF